jgi:hypothetical protein
MIYILQRLFRHWLADIQKMCAYYHCHHVTTLKIGERVTLSEPMASNQKGLTLPNIRDACVYVHISVLKYQHEHTT